MYKEISENWLSLKLSEIRLKMAKMDKNEKNIKIKQE